MNNFNNEKDINYRMKILIAADSMAMPRPGTPYEDTWIFRLNEHFPCCHIIDKSERGSNTERLVTAGGGGIDLLELYTPDLVVLQMGMMDAAPRLFRKDSFEYRFLQKIPARFRKKYVDYMKKNRGRLPETTDVTPEKFRDNLINYFSRAQRLSCTVIAIIIAKPNRYLMIKSPHAHVNIEKYNAIYREAASGFSNVYLIEPFDRDYDYDRIMVDELHHNAEGGEIIAGKIKNEIERLIGLGVLALK